MKVRRIFFLMSALGIALSCRSAEARPPGDFIVGSNGIPIVLPNEHPSAEHLRAEDRHGKLWHTRRSIWVSVWINLGLTAVQFFAGLFSAFRALIADSIHSLSDLLSDFVVLFAERHSRKDADIDHHYGHLRYENAASLVLGVLMLAVACGMGWASFGKLLGPDEP